MQLLAAYYKLDLRFLWLYVAVVVALAVFLGVMIIREVRARRRHSQSKR